MNLTFYRLEFLRKYLFYYPIFAIIAFYPLIKSSFNYCFNVSVVNKIYFKSSRKFELKTENYDYLKKILLSIVLIFYSAGLSISYFGGYPRWIHNYTTMDDQFKFYFNVIKTIPNLF